VYRPQTDKADQAKEPHHGSIPRCGFLMQLRVADDVEEQDMRDLELNFFLNFSGISRSTLARYLRDAAPN
jgi:hypothetical protein